MIYPIYIYGHPVLRQKAKTIEPDFPNLKDFIANMFETMEVSDGVGLAAPQAGFSLRLFVLDGNPLSEDFPEAIGFRQVFINPEIVEELGEPWYYNEGCLSVPGIREDVKRSPILKLKYVDENFVEHIEVFDGIKARIIQHEYDHLEGKMLIDHISPIKRQLLRKKLNDLIKGHLKVNYKTVCASK